MAVSESHNSFSGTGYDSGIWQARHAIAKSIILIFSIFYLAFKGAWGAVKGFFAGIFNGWSEGVKPLISK